VQVTTGAIAGTYLVINDSTDGFQSSNDLLINITGFTGTLPALGNIPVGNFWLFGLCYAMEGGYKGWNPYIERHLAIFVNCFLSRAN